MAKASLTLASGTKVLIEGTEDEVAKLLLRMDGSDAVPAAQKRTVAKASSAKRSIGDLIGGLVDDGFFKKPVELNLVKAALEEQGHYFTRSAIPTQLLRLVKRRQLRRIKQDGQWRYVG